jgi:hypothetical protein
MNYIFFSVAQKCKYITTNTNCKQICSGLVNADYKTTWYMEQKSVKVVFKQEIKNIIIL